MERSANTKRYEWTRALWLTVPGLKQVSGNKAAMRVLPAVFRARRLQTPRRPQAKNRVHHCVFAEQAAKDIFFSKKCKTPVDIQEALPFTLINAREGYPCNLSGNPKRKTYGLLRSEV